MYKFIECIKQISGDAVQSSYPTEIVFGTVISVNPLQIQISQKLILPEEFLVLSNNVKDHTTEVTINFATQDSAGGTGYSAYAAHNHVISGKTKVTIHNALKEGETVILMRMQGGQKYIVIDRGGG